MENETNKGRVWGLLKFSDNKDHLRDFIENGIMYMNTINYFKKLECGTGRSDELEGATLVLGLKGGKLTIDHPEHGSVTLNLNGGTAQNFVNGNISCFYGLYDDHFLNNQKTLLIDERVYKDFGKHVVFVKDIGLLFERFAAAVNKLGYRYRRGKVNYNYEMTDDIEQNLDFFSKQKKYSYQSEYRFFVETERDEILKLELGSLKDFTWLLPADELKNFTINTSISSQI